MTRRVILVRFLVLLVAIGLGGCGEASRPAQVLQSWCEPGHRWTKPRECASPSKAFRLEIVPISNSLHPEDPPYPGSGGAKYRMTYKGREIWAGERDYALQDPLVTDDGTVVGVAYRDEYENDKPWSYVGEFFHIVIIRDGRDVQNWTVKRTPLPFEVNVDPPSRPVVEILTVDRDNDRVIASVIEPDDSLPGHAACWLFRLSTGEILPRIDFTQLLATLGYVDPAKIDKFLGVAARVSELKIVAGTPLILVHCRRHNNAYAKEGPWSIQDSLFILIESNGNPVWSLFVPRNSAYAVEGSFPHYRQRWEPPQPLLITGKPGYFGVYRTWEESVESYSVKNHGAEGWKVTRIGRTTLAQARREHGVESQPAPP